MEHYRHEIRKVSDLIPYINNSRTHSDQQLKQIAASIKEFGFTNPILTDNKNGIIAGHGRVIAAEMVGLDTLPCIVIEGLSDTQRKALIIADNQLALNADWNIDLLKVEIEDLKGNDFELEILGFDDSFLAMLEDQQTIPGLTDENEIPEIQEDPITQEGDVWILGDHRVMCGDSTRADHVEQLMDGQKAELIHADPPYGMGKEADGVLNDNLYREKLDQFQIDWWVLFRTYTEDNGSAYIWGNAADLWRFYYGKLEPTEHMEIRNEIVWDKKTIPGMKSDLLTQYPITTERCLFIQLGKQFLGNVNTEDFPEQFAPLLDYLKGEADAAGIKPKDIKRVCGCQMYSHWFSRSQFHFISFKHYQSLHQEYPNHFQRPWQELKTEWDRVKGANSKFRAARHGQIRSYFNNGHDIMRDVWEFPRVQGDERHGHATPKPVEMMARIMKSSLADNGLCVEPFGGSGSTLMAAEQTNRICYTMEMDPRYCDVIVRRWQNYTGKKAHNPEGELFDEHS